MDDCEEVADEYTLGYDGLSVHGYQLASLEEGVIGCIKYSDSTKRFNGKQYYIIYDNKNYSKIMVFFNDFKAKKAKNVLLGLKNNANLLENELRKFCVESNLKLDSFVKSERFYNSDGQEKEIVITISERSILEDDVYKDKNTGEVKSTLCQMKEFTKYCSNYKKYHNIRLVRSEDIENNILGYPVFHKHEIMCLSTFIIKYLKYIDVTTDKKTNNPAIKYMAIDDRKKDIYFGLHYAPPIGGYIEWDVIVKYNLKRVT